MEQKFEAAPGADPFATSINLVIPDAARTVPLPPTATPAGGTALPPPPAAPPGGTGWTGSFPVVRAVPPAPTAAPVADAPPPAHGIGGGLRGRILVIEGGYGGGRRWGRGGGAHTSVLSAALAGVAPQVLLSADQVDAVHLPGASDPQTVLAHLRAAARHPGPLLIHLGGHLITDRRGEQLYLSLRENKSSESLPWSAIATELRHRGTELDTLVIGDLSADQVVWPTLAATAGQQLADGVPLWAVVNHDPDQLGTFTLGLIEALHRGRPGADQFLTPELVRQQVSSVLRADTVVITSHPVDRPYFRNTARQIGTGEPAAPLQARSDTAARAAVGAGAAGGTAAPEPVRPRLSPGWTPRGLVSLRKAGVPATPPRRAMVVSLVKGEPMVPADTQSTVPLTPTSAGPAAPPVALDKPGRGAPRVELGKGTGAPTGAGAGDTATEPLPTLEPAPAASAASAASAVTFAKEAAPAGAGDTLAATLPIDRPVTIPIVERGPEPEPTPRHDPLAATTPLPGRGAPAAAGPASTGTVRLGKGSDAPPPQPSVDRTQAPPSEYLEAIGDIVRSAEAGDHETASALALALEEKAVGAYGARATVVLQVRQVRAHVCRVGGRPAVAAELYRQVAAALLQSDGPEHPETQRAVTNAEACWRAVEDPAEAIRLAPDIIELRAHLPGPDNRKLRAAERYLRQLAENRG
ncbi:hypothetical protein Kpho02_04600 [Kitasatospora phosalacinea]|uniref:Uncharacterized protein n=1 Tax=Kitasatospora phosalacinea TaxID=2065 RepID=A0A9W6UXZ2_9ACTN|nr:hypothetical protein Kpho02_04600 [Kitasatospora phosalacinea]